MKALYFDGNLKYLEDYQKPVKNAGEVLIKVSLAAVCNTDKEILRGYKNFKGVLGHEFVGVVEEADSSSLIGKRVVGNINIGCGECEFCRSGMKNHCNNIKVLGIWNKDGSFAEYMTLPEENIFIVPDSVPDIQAVFTEPLAAAFEITEFNHIRPTDKVAVVGNGKLGRMISIVLNLTGCDLTIFGRRKEGLKEFRELGNVALTSEFKEKRFFDVVVDCTGNDGGLLFAQQIVKPRGKIILKSTYNDKVSLNPTNWVVDEFALIGSRCGPMDAALRAIEKKNVNLDFLIGNIYALKDYEKAFNEKGNTKAIFDLSK